ncbi:hypothetical protein HO173_006341 [Letharia columbiana]|uniref:Extracellular membrane protein CFEM domain-containing protein n=1 Tax=Letharia columbiana TaxID=112416 RepID=A0A8H6FVW2_9LECA|nr:uncharacterized protein HO173_006341 [Letharia columbiana]KAF6235658.1 hypothetical protein HO173_006341 [Letharia columbiana]
MILHLLISVFLAGVSLSLIQAHQNVSTILSHCAQHCTLQAFNQSTCTATNHTYAAVFNKCEIENCTAAEQNVTNAFALSLCSQVGRYKHINSTTSPTAASVSRTATPTGNGTMIYNSTTMHNGTFMGSPAPFTGGSGVVTACGAVVLAGLLLGGMVVAL